MNLHHSPLFQGLAPEALHDIQRQMKLCCYEPNEFLCRQGESGDRLFIMQSGLVEIFIEKARTPIVLDRLRRGDILGEMALITGEPRTANAMAIMPTEVLELSRDAFATIISHHPNVLFNISHILIQRQKRSNNVLLQKHHHGEAVAIFIGRHTRSILTKAINRIQKGNPGNTAFIDLTGTLDIDRIAIENPSTVNLLEKLDDLLTHYKMVFMVFDASQYNTPVIMRNMDRIELIAEPSEADSLYQSLKELAKQIRCILAPSKSTEPSVARPDLPVLRTLSPTAPEEETAWLARHLTRRKLGLALGAGGARGYAHVGAMRVFRQAGIPIDYITGSSIGAMVGSFMAMGMDADAIAAQLDAVWSPETVSQLGVFSPEGHSVGLRNAMQAATDAIGETTFADLQTPLTIMTADLNAQQAAPISEGALADALCAGITIPGMAPPRVRGAQRLVDGITITPVPVAAARDAGADQVISINLLNRNTLADWPADANLPPFPPKSSRMLDPVIETLVMLQLDTSVRNANEADVVVTPLLPALSWRDYHYAEPIQRAGRRAAEAQLSQVMDLVRP
jgi:predicted acylesterase/phospholipase RssA/CRP-like cAMP-binding protein